MHLVIQCVTIHSLQNMYKTLQTDIEGFRHPGHGYLGGWAEQGIEIFVYPS